MEHINDGQKPKKRSLTDLTLGWLAEKLRRSEEIKKKVQDGTYLIESNKLAERIIKPES